MSNEAIFIGIQTERSSTTHTASLAVGLTASNVTRSGVELEGLDARHALRTIVDTSIAVGSTLNQTGIIVEAGLALRTVLSGGLALLEGVGQTVGILLTALSVYKVVVSIADGAGLVFVVHLLAVRDHLLAEELVEGVARPAFQAGEVVL